MAIMKKIGVAGDGTNLHRSSNNRHILGTTLTILFPPIHLRSMATRNRDSGQGRQEFDQQEEVGRDQDQICTSR